MNTDHSPMSIYQSATQRIAKTYYKALFMRQARQVLETHPVAPGSLPMITLSMVHTRDVIPYLLALKSFHRHVPAQRTVVVCDPSITDADKTTFRRHVPHIELRDAAEFTHPSVPRGGCWERLFAISEYSRNHFTVQLDADTVATAPLQEIEESVVTNHAFVIGEVRNQRIDPVGVYAEHARKQPSSHVQSVSEAALDTLGLPADTRYVRGCAGFTGFVPSNDMRERLVDFSERMHARIGNRWQEWGTEQVTSNFLVANQAGACVLPYPKYASSHRTDADSVFFHFIGSVRFRDRHYENTARKTLVQLQ